MNKIPSVKSAFEPKGPSGRSLSRLPQHEATKSISTPPWMALSSLVPIYTPGWREALWELSVLPKNTTQCPWPGLEPGPLAPESSALTMRPPRLPQNTKHGALEFQRFHSMNKIPSVEHLTFQQLHGTNKIPSMVQLSLSLNPLTPVLAVTGSAKTHSQFPAQALTDREKHVRTTAFSTLPEDILVLLLFYCC